MADSVLCRYEIVEFLMVDDVCPAVRNNLVMGDKGEACAECSRSCSSLHRTMHDPYPIVSSFFKIMFGKLFSDLLHVPPKFAKTIIALEGKDTYLEDPTGQKWKVNLCNVNGSLTFQKGWHDFSVDHNIELGDMVVFHYFKGSHFIVQIFGKSGCEKPMIYSGMDYQNKRAKSTRTDPCDSPCNKESTPEKECLDTCMETEPNVDVHNVEIPPEVGANVSRKENINEQPLVLSSTDVLVESIFITDRDTDCASEDRRIIDLHDLSVFEQPGNKTDADKMSMLTCSEVPNPLLKIPSEEALPDALNFQMAETTDEILSFEMPGNKTDAGKLSMLTDCTLSESEIPNPLQKIPSEEALPDAVNIQMAETTNDISNEEDGSRKECVPVLNGNVSGAEVPLDVYMPLKSVTLPHKPEFSAPGASVEPPREELRIIEPEPKSGNVICGLEANIVSRDSEIVFTRKVHRVKKEVITYHSNSSIDKNKGLMSVIVKQEDPEFCDSPTLDMKITCLVQQDTEPFLELPKPIPVKLRKQGESLEQSLVVLQDPLRRLWPVVYHQRKGTRVLADGWREFRKANCIKRGDECTFTVKNTNEGIIQVQIVSHLA